SPGVAGGAQPGRPRRRRNRGAPPYRRGALLPPPGDRGGRRPQWLTGLRQLARWSIAMAATRAHVGCRCDTAIGGFMRRAIAVHRRGAWPEEAALDTVTLAYVDRHRRRIRLVSDAGAPFLLNLSRVHHLVEGDGLELDTGAYVR